MSKKQDKETPLFGIEKNLESDAPRQIPNTVLSLSNSQKNSLSNEDVFRIQHKLNEMPPLNMGEINFVPIEAGVINDGYYVNLFVRNGRELLDQISLSELHLFLIDATGERVAGAVFHPETEPPLKFGESRFYTFVWEKDSVYKQGADLSSFKIDFQ